MKAMIRSRFSRLFAIAVSMGVFTWAVAALFGEADPVDPPYRHQLHQDLVARQATGIEDLVGRFLWDQESYLWIAPPAEDFILIQTGETIPILDLKAFPASFIDNLAGEIGADGVVRFPIWIYEDADSPGREIVIESLEQNILARIERERDYSPEWFVRGWHPELDTYDASYRDWLVACYDPARVCMRYDLLVGEDDLIQYVWARSIEAAQREEERAAAEMMRSEESGSVSNLQFTALGLTTNGMVELTLAWPDTGLSTNVVDIFACTDLRAQDWVLADTLTLDMQTNRVVWVDTVSTNHTTRFYDAWTHHDSDGDGIPDGREVRLYGTDPHNWDTDGDGLSDYDEIYVYGTDPIGTYNSLLPFFAGFEVPEGYSPGVLNGQRGWDSDGGVVQGGMAYSGEQALENEGLEVSATKYFAATNHLVTARVFIFLGPQFSVPDTLPGSASSLVSFESGTGLRAFDGNGAGGGAWVSAPNTADLLNRWVELEIAQDYTAQTWNLLVDGVLKLSGLGFKDSALTQPGALHIRSGIGGAVFSDNVDVR